MRRRKNIVTLLAMLPLLLLYNKINAQPPVIETCDHQSSHVVFSDDVVYADVGDGENYIFEYTNNILRLKGQETERTTNLTVITSAEDYYSFRVVYRNTPMLNYFITRGMRIANIAKERNIPRGILIPDAGRKSGGSKKSIVKKEEVKPFEGEKKQLPPTLKKEEKEKENLSDTRERENPKAELFAKASSLVEQASLYNHIGTRHGDIRLKVDGIYHDLNHCFIVYSIQNRGAVPYDISYIEFGIREQRRPKKSARNEKIVKPVFTLREEINMVYPKRLNRYVAVFEKLAIPKGKILYMEVVEQGRNFTLDIPWNRLTIKRLK